MGCLYHWGKNDGSRRSGECQHGGEDQGLHGWSHDSRFVATRFEAAINAGKSTRFDANVGKTLEFACQADTLAMTVKSVEQIADVAK